MELDKVLSSRKSIRAYDPERPVSRETLLELVSAALQAPTWKNSQTGRYYIITDPEKLARVRETCLPERNASNCAGAKALIVTAFVKGRSGFQKDGTPDNELGDHWGAYDLGLQTENLLLKAASEGLGTLVMGLRDGDALRSQLGIPENQEVVSVISVGWPAADPAKPARKSADDVTVWF